MAVSTTKRKYSLVGENTILALQRGLAEATWYTSPVPKEQMRELLERRDGPALCDTIIWFALLIGVRGERLRALEGRELVGGDPLHDLRGDLRVHFGFALARIGPRHGVQDGLDEQCALRDRFLHGDARVCPLALEPRAPP